MATIHTNACLGGEDALQQQSDPVSSKNPREFAKPYPPGSDLDLGKPGLREFVLKLREFVLKLREFVLKLREWPHSNDF